MLRLAVAGALAAGCAAEAPAGSEPGVLMTERELAQLTSVPVSTLPAHTGTAFDCKMRAYAYEYAQTLQKWRGPAKMKEVFDSLELATLCHQEFDGSLFDAVPRARLHELPSDAVTAFVDPRASGDAQLRSALNDAGAPFGTVHEAVASIRAQRAASAPDQRAYVVLREGTHYLSRTLELGPEDSRLSFVNYPGEVTSMSGAKPITTDWKPHRVGEAGADIFVADLSQQSIRSIPGLRVDGKRGVRASYPNRDPELSIFPDGWVTDKTMWTPPIPPVKNESFVTLASPMLHDKTMFQQYMVGVGGHCEHYTPPVSYWCSEHPSGGGAFAFRVPSGLTYPKLKAWKNPKGGIVNAWRPSHWANWMFEIDQWDATSKTIGFGKGGFQGARGNNVGAEWYVENVFEELDNPNEYFFDEEAQKLYYAPNSTTGGPPSGKFEAVINQTIVKLVGTQQHPVEDVTFQGITFRDSAYTYMEPHGVPSGGDWGLQRMGAIHLEGTKGVTIAECLVTRVDGNAVMLSGYNRNTTISRNEFVWIGDSVIASWGYTAPLGGAANDDVLAQYKSGVDGTNGEQPRGTVASENFIHELGHFEKQSSPWFQAKSCQNVIKRNIFFNMPRAGINFNDGFGGGSIVTENLGYNTCRESSDHAVFNSWDRQPFLTDVGQKAPEPDLNPAYNTISRNFFIGNYGASMSIDNDDGSSYYYITDNFEVYGGHKSNFGGHNKLRSGAVIPFSKVYQEGLCCRVNAQNLGKYTDGYFNNTCIQSAKNLTAYSFAYCDNANVNNITNLGILHDNKVYNPDGKMMVLCGNGKGIGSHGPITAKLLTEAEFQATGADPGTTVHVTPEYDEIIGWARGILEPLQE